jgi:hypothetical protein
MEPYHVKPRVTASFNCRPDGLRVMLRKQEKRPGCSDCKDDRIRWPNKFFATAGLFTLDTARRQARQSRTRNPSTGAPYARNRLYGSEGGEAKTLPYPNHLSTRWSTDVITYMM